MSSKITIIGAGSVGSTIAYTLSNEDIASEIVQEKSRGRGYGYRAGYLLPRSGLHHRR